MDRTKLLRIIQKDLEELNEITGDLTRRDEAFNHEIEFALSKSRIICQEFEFLKELTVQPLKQKMAEYPKAETASAKIPDHIPPEMPSPSEIPGAKKQELPEEAGDNTGELAVPVEKTPLATGIRLEDTPAREQEYPETESPGQASATGVEPTEENKGKRTVGEFFIQGKSRNDDLLSENKTLDQKLADSPVARLSQAIGLNDRFQFIRELFNNDADLFRQTVEQIDQMENRNEAVLFLSSNFKWRKNDTSLKFAQLVKRRFSE